MIQGAEKKHQRREKIRVCEIMFFLCVCEQLQVEHWRKIIRPEMKMSWWKQEKCEYLPWRDHR